jgi:hypothetical protein
MIKKRYELGTSSFFHSQLKKEIPIKLFMVAYDVAPQDWKPKVHPRTGEVLPGRPFTLGELKQRWGDKLQATFSHPLSKEVQKFQFDFSPWAHLPDDTHLEIEWPFSDLNASDTKPTEE